MITVSNPHLRPSVPIDNFFFSQAADEMAIDGAANVGTKLIMVAFRKYLSMCLL